MKLQKYFLLLFLVFVPNHIFSFGPPMHEYQYFIYDQNDFKETFSSFIIPMYNSKGIKIGRYSSYKKKNRSVPFFKIYFKKCSDWKTELQKILLFYKNSLLKDVDIYRPNKNRIGSGRIIYTFMYKGYYGFMSIVYGEYKVIDRNLERKIFQGLIKRNFRFYDTKSNLFGVKYNHKSKEISRYDFKIISKEISLQKIMNSKVPNTIFHCNKDKGKNYIEIYFHFFSSMCKYKNNFYPFEYNNASLQQTKGAVIYEYPSFGAKKVGSLEYGKKVKVLRIWKKMRYFNRLSSNDVWAEIGDNKWVYDPLLRYEHQEEIDRCYKQLHTEGDLRLFDFRFLDVTTKPKDIRVFD